jgi:tol-pal system protein YbgF
MKRVSVLLLLAVLVTSPALPIRKGEKLVLDKIEKLEKMLTRMNEELAIVSSDVSTIFKKIVIMENKLNSLTQQRADNQLSSQNLYENILAFQQDVTDIKQQLGELSRTLSRTAGSSPVSGEESGPVNNNGMDTASEETPEEKSPNLYFIAYSDYINKNYNLAIRGFSKFISYYPDTLRATKARYWIGECYYAQRNYQQAIEVFDRLIEEDSEGANVSDAMLKKGYALVALGRHMEARQVLTQLIDKYPFSEISALAKQKLKEISE